MMTTTEGIILVAVALCPRCKENHYAPYKLPDGSHNPHIVNVTPSYAALSRRDNATDICSDCGNAEAFEDMGMAPPWTGERYWQVDDD